MRADKRRRRPASIRKAARIGKYDKLRLRVHDDLVRLNVGGRLRFRVIGADRWFLSHLRVRGRLRDDGAVLRSGAGVTPRRDLLIILLGRQIRIMLHCCR